MSGPDLGVSDTVVIRCHACGASGAKDASALNRRPDIVCRECGETWPAPGRPDMRQAAGKPSADRSPGSGAAFRYLEAERRPLISYSAGLSKAWAAKIEGDILPEHKPPSRVRPFAAASLAALFLVLLIAGREWAVEAAPDLARLYAAVGLPVNLAGVAIEDVAAERTVVGDAGRVVVRGTIRSFSQTERSLPPLTARLYALDGAAAGLRTFEPPAASISAGDELPFQVEFDSVAAEAVEIVVRFRRPEDPILISRASDESE